MKIELLESFLTGHHEIDEDHRNLVETINLVSEAIDSKEMDQCKSLLDSFVEVAKNHFAREEAILREIKYPGIEKHCEYHDGLLGRANIVKRLCQDMAERGKLKDCFEGMANFFIDDVVKGDVMFVSYLEQVGVTKKT